MTSIIDPNLSRLKCIGYKYGYNNVILHSLPDLVPYSGIIFTKDLDFENVSELCINVPFKVIEDYIQTNDFDIIANYVEEYLKQSTELDMHYV